MNKKRTKITILIIFFFILVFSFSIIKEIKAAAARNISGWAWSENIGWISLDCNNQASCKTVDYGLNVGKDGRLSGYGWSENIGWISFNKDDLTNCPASTCEAKLNSKTNKISGWARTLSYKDPGAGGWDGWISLSDLKGTSYGIIVDPQKKTLSGWAWGSDVIGWISFNYAKFLGVKPEAKNLSADKDNPADYCFVTSYAPVRLRWEFSSTEPSSSQSAYRVEIYDNSGNLIDRSCDNDDLSNPSARCTCLPEELCSEAYLSHRLHYKSTYSWRVMVWDNYDNPSDWANGDKFTTIDHPYPYPAFEWSPIKPAAKEIITMKDLTSFYDNKPNKRSWDWDFNDGTHSDLSNPTHSYENPNLAGYKVILGVTDGDKYGPCSLTKNLSVTFPAPSWQESPPPSQ